MKKAWVEKKNKERMLEREKTLEEIKAILSRSLDEDEIDLCAMDISENIRIGLYLFSPSSLVHMWEEKYSGDNSSITDKKYSLYRLRDEVEKKMRKLFDLRYDFDDLLDSDPMEFDGDIIITDPCYIMREDSDDWGKCGYGSEMEVLGIEHYMTRNTIYGDWSCTVFNSDNKEVLGRFCADAGLVSVFLLDEILKYNPYYNDYIAKDWTATLINDFKGTVQFVVKQTSFQYKGEKCYDYSVKVVGKGINKKTGEPLNFYSSQTGL